MLGNCDWNDLYVPSINKIKPRNHQDLWYTSDIPPESPFLGCTTKHLGIIYGVMICFYERFQCDALLRLIDIIYYFLVKSPPQF